MSCKAVEMQSNNSKQQVALQMSEIRHNDEVTYHFIRNLYVVCMCVHMIVCLCVYVSVYLCVHVCLCVRSCMCYQNDLGFSIGNPCVCTLTQVFPLLRPKVSCIHIQVKILSVCRFQACIVSSDPPPYQPSLSRLLVMCPSLQRTILDYMMPGAS